MGSGALNAFSGCGVSTLPNCFSTTFLKNGGIGESLTTSTCLNTLDMDKQGHAFVCSNKCHFLCQLNFMELIGITKLR